MLNIKRTIVFMLIITLTISLALSGCSSPQTNQSAQNEQPSQSSEEITRQSTRTYRGINGNCKYRR